MTFLHALGWLLFACTAILALAVSVAVASLILTLAREAAAGETTETLYHGKADDE